MKLSGYSDTPLLSKLGYEQGQKVYAVGAPEFFINELLEGKIEVTSHMPTTWLHGFFETQEHLREFLETLPFEHVEKGIWVSWPKKASKIPTDLTEQTFRDAILPLGWVDTKVCAIDSIWSGLKFVRRAVAPSEPN